MDKEDCNKVKTADDWPAGANGNRDKKNPSDAQREEDAATVRGVQQSPAGASTARVEDGGAQAQAQGIVEDPTDAPALLHRDDILLLDPAADLPPLLDEQDIPDLLSSAGYMPFTEHDLQEHWTLVGRPENSNGPLSTQNDSSAINQNIADSDHTVPFPGKWFHELKENSSCQNYPAIPDGNKSFESDVNKRGFVNLNSSTSDYCALCDKIHQFGAHDVLKSLRSLQIDSPEKSRHSSDSETLDPLMLSNASYHSCVSSLEATDFQNNSLVDKDCDLQNIENECNETLNGSGHFCDAEDIEPLRINDLPYELLTKVMSYLNHDDLCLKVKQIPESISIETFFLCIVIVSMLDMNFKIKDYNYNNLII